MLPPTVSKRLYYIVFGVLFTLILASFYNASPTEYSSRLLDQMHCAKAGPDPIPNIVHYVWILKPGHSFALGFKQFVSIYSSHYYLKPDIIYIHTDVSREEFEHAKLSGDDWTKRILNLPAVTYHKVDVPTKTNKGLMIGKFEHKSDFIRTAMLAQFGGFYLDTDAIPLRSVATFLNSGFANIVGVEVRPTTVNNGVMMCKPNSTLVTIFKDAQHEYYDGGWTTASTALLGEVSFRLSAVEGEVLVLGVKAFQAVSWRGDDAVSLWKEHEDKELPGGGDDAATPQVLSNPQGREEAMQWWESRRKKDAKGSESWVADYSSSYVLHAFDNAEVEGFKPEDVSLEYVLRRRSNYARAVYPAIWDAIKQGII